MQQTVKVVAPLSPDLCLEAFSYTNRVLFITNGSRNDVQVTFESSSDDIPDSVILDGGQIYPVMLRPQIYTVVAKERPAQGEALSETHTVDLTSVPAKTEVLFSTDTIDRIRGEQHAALYLESREIYPDYAKTFRESSTTLGDAELSQARAGLAEVKSQYLDAGNALASVEQQSSEPKEGIRCSSIGTSCSESKRAFEEADSRVQQAMAVEQEERAREWQLKADLSQFERKRFLAQGRVDRLEALKSGAEVLEQSSVTIGRLRKEIQQKLSTIYPNVTDDQRGVVVTIPQKSWGKAANDLSRFVQVMQGYPTLKIVVEVCHPGQNSLENQLSARQSAKAIADSLVTRGLASGNLGFAGTIEKSTAVTRIIVSP